MPRPPRAHAAPVILASASRAPGARPGHHSRSPAAHAAPTHAQRRWPRVLPSPCEHPNRARCSHPRPAPPPRAPLPSTHRRMPICLGWPRPHALA
ncbi:hypothetical protein U9M48_037733 [Paspalum notatum var. saurae]|uniref:Uncharacterized protein n=1 Tax=Paspalum notatum var. saurae TaxID=547442 RepID=A0AAQ3UHR7_PASNO